MSGYTSIVDATPAFVPGTFDGQDVRLATIGNSMPGLFARGDFAVTQRAAGANMSVDIGAGRAYVDPAAVARQGSYLVWSGSTINTLSNGGYTWAAADPANPRIDLLCIEVADTDFSGSYTGYKFRIVDGTPNAGATHQLATTYWPAVPAGCVPLAAIRIPAAATTITTANITNLNAVGGPRASSYNSIAGVESTTSATYTRLTTPDFVCAYVPHAAARVRYGYQGQIRISTASGNQRAALFINDQQLRYSTASGAPAVAEKLASPMGTTFYNRIYTTPGLPTQGIQFSNVAAVDVSDVPTGQLVGSDLTTGAGELEIFGLAAGWYVFEMRFNTSANTLSLRNRFMWAEVSG